jgi:hypothetical protein
LTVEKDEDLKFGHNVDALIKKSIKFSSYIRNSDGSGCCKVIYCMRKGFLIYEEMLTYLTIYEEAVIHI